MICTRSVYISKLLLFTIFISKVNKVVKKKTKQNCLFVSKYRSKNLQSKSFNIPVFL